MKMTFKKFIETGGIPAEETYYYAPGIAQEHGYINCVKDEALINRNIKSNALSRLRRKLYYDYHLGTIPVKMDALHQRKLFWGSATMDFHLKTLNSFFPALSKVKQKDKYLVFVGGTDDPFTDELAEMIPDSVENVFAANCAAVHPKLTWYPLGRDHVNRDVFDIAPKQVKEKLVYSNFSIGTHSDRKRVRELMVGKDFITNVNIEGHGLYNGYPMTRAEFVAELNDHAFSISPRGRGVDTFRMWDSLHLGVIPIVVKETGFQSQLSNLPILFIDSVEDYGDLTPEYLQSKRDEMLETEYDFSMLIAEYWSKQFHGDSSI